MCVLIEIEKVERAIVVHLRTIPFSSLFMSWEAARGSNKAALLLLLLLLLEALQTLSLLKRLCENQTFSYFIKKKFDRRQSRSEPEVRKVRPVLPHY